VSGAVSDGDTWGRCCRHAGLWGQCHHFTPCSAQVSPHPRARPSPNVSTAELWNPQKQVGRRVLPTRLFPPGSMSWISCRGVSGGIEALLDDFELCAPHVDSPEVGLVRGALQLCRPAVELRGVGEWLAWPGGSSRAGTHQPSTSRLSPRETL
jgi:hypothetical protein